MNTSVDAHVTTECIIAGGHKPGIIRIGDITLFFTNMLWGNGDTLAMESLRDECEAQISAFKAQRTAPVSAPADPPPLPLDAPIEQVAAPYMTPVDVLPQGQPVEVCWRCKGSGQRPLDETMGSSGDHPCPECRPQPVVVVDLSVDDDIPF